ncbi:carboxymuconolactone decarboxylase family protein [Bradyrhizobium guangzhouense]|uniref:Carboxymuconolactone decarboxylase family protein n=1 Tax=Bradyrhizobium guangzhouense TaxID=1325095 RepID=A0AAE5WX93_9BRAD|nr:carboxymuconolactone decarboxylase family protein [Bradyrhizobium guangzhouense]QAU44761.1 carboxymuconolactone decarboxylase family protein [Bradyrhizobium guangzhouense]RXH05061.1 carboxymuconolactone decarboxylase family protein [Bradyrhizobium guangzhouense]
MQRFAPPEPTQLAGESRQLLAQVKLELGSEPIMMRLLSHSPAALRGFLALRQSLTQASLPLALRERIAIAVAAANECHCCAANHRHFGQRAGIPECELDAAAAATSDDPGAAAALRFTRALVQSRGHVDDAELASMRAAGFDEAAIIEVVAVVSANMFANFVNNLAQSIPDHFAAN